MRGDRKKQEEREKEKREDENEADQNSKIINVSNYQPKQIPQLMWHKCIKKVWEVDPLTHSNIPRHLKNVPYDDGWPGYDEPVFDFLITPKDQQALWGRITLFTRRHKPFHGGLTAAVLAADTREKSDPAA